MEGEDGFSRVGNARTTDECQVEQVIGLLNLPLKEQASYKKIEVGITNTNWVIRGGEEAFFVKIYGANTHILIDRKAAVRASIQSGDLGIGPKLVARFENLGAEVYEYLEGYRNSTADDLRDPTFRANLLSNYKKMHTSARIPLTRTGIEQLEQRYASLQSEGVALPEDVPALIDLCRVAGERVAATNPPSCPCHNDSYAPNFMIRDADKSIRIVDWEYAANNDPTWDLTMIALSSALPPDEVDWFAEYFGVVPELERLKFALYGGILAVSWGIWARLQTRYSSISFDYLAYSDMLFDYGRNLIAGDAWKEAMCRLS